jgi:putative membrane protein
MRPHVVLLALSFALAASTGIGLVPLVAEANPNASSKLSADGEALATLAAVNQHEIETARQAIRKGVTGGVLDFARKMQEEHTKNLADTREVARLASASMAETASVKELKQKALGERQALQKLSGDAYARAYVEAMVKGHSEVLDMLDKKLVPQATDSKVIAHLKATRAHVAEHLAAATALQAKQRS